MPSESLYNEQEILRQIAQGDEPAFRRLFHHYKNRIYSYAMYFTGAVPLAEEITQDVFLQAWLHRETLPDITKMEAWLYTIARNLSFNYLKKLALESERRDLWADQDTVAAGSTDERVVQKDYQQLVQQAVNKLPPQQKQVYLLSREQGLKPEEIAKQLNISPNTVKVHLAQALRTIRLYLHIRMEIVLIACSAAALADH